MRDRAGLRAVVADAIETHPSASIQTPAVAEARRALALSPVGGSAACAAVLGSARGYSCERCQGVLEIRRRIAAVAIGSVEPSSFDGV
jgi:hypothetical protein